MGTLGQKPQNIFRTHHSQKKRHQVTVDGCKNDDTSGIQSLFTCINDGFIAWHMFKQFHAENNVKTGFREPGDMFDVRIDIADVNI